MGDDTRPLEGQRVLTKEGCGYFRHRTNPRWGPACLHGPKFALASFTSQTTLPTPPPSWFFDFVNHVLGMLEPQHYTNTGVTRDSSCEWLGRWRDSVGAYMLIKKQVAVSPL